MNECNCNKLEAKFIELTNELSAEIGDIVTLETEPVNITVERTEDGVLLTAKDVKGETSAVILDGQRGADGQDGFSPIIDTEPTPNGYQMTITSADGTHTIDIVDGRDGVNGKDGRDGRDGVDGKDYIITPSDYDAIADVTKDKVNLSSYATKTYVDDAIEGLELVEIVTALPSVGQSNKTYLLAKSDGAETDLYDEYLWINGRYELIGSKTIKVDLDDYVKSTDWASGSRGGVFITSGSYGISVSANGYLQAITKSYAQYETMSNNGFIGKGTLEQVFNGKGFLTSADVPSFDNYTVIGYMSGVPSGTIHMDVYKNGEPCTEHLYLDLYYSDAKTGKPTIRSSRSGYYDGTYEVTYSKCYKYYAKWYKDETKRELLCSASLNYGITGDSVTDDHINDLIDAKLGVIENGSY